MTTSFTPTESYVNQQLSEQKFDSLSLSIQITINEVSFCVTDTKTENYLAIFNYTLAEKTDTNSLLEFFNQIFENQVLLNKTFTEVNVSFKNNTATLVPAELYDNEQLESYLAFIKLDNIAEYTISTDFIKEIDAYNIYALPKTIEKTVLSKFTNAKFVHQSTSFIKSIFINNSNLLNNNKVFVNKSNNEFELCIFKQAKFKLYNSFQFKTDEDFLYYLLFAMKQFECEPAQTEIVLTGKIAEQSSIHQLLKKYIAIVSFASTNCSNNLKSLLNEMPEYYYFTLLNLSKCV